MAIFVKIVTFFFDKIEENILLAEWEFLAFINKKRKSKQKTKEGAHKQRCFLKLTHLSEYEMRLHFSACE